MNVLMIDDHPLILAAMQNVVRGLGEGVQLTGVETVEEARELLSADHSFDLVVLDLFLGAVDGHAVLLELRRTWPALPVVVVSASESATDVIRCIDGGAMGFVPKRASNEMLFEALMLVLDGGIYVSEAVSNAMIQKFAAGGSYQSTNPIDGLSNRELQVLQMIGKGLSTREVADTLNLSVKTVESHRQRIKRKLGLATGAQLVQYAVNWCAGREGVAA
jgi:DNA-binding NarL/FixJ family response regulator